jgi:acyl-CoA synthetase (AMP-forming)/AMP-acid ligase II
MGAIGTLLIDRATAHPDAPCLLDADSGEARTYAEVAQAARRWAAWYGQSGLEPGARVGVVLANGPTFVEAYLGAALAGVVLAPWHAALTAPELSALAARHRVRVVLSGTNRAPELAAALPVPVQPVGTRQPAPLALPEPLKDLPAVAHDAPLVLVQTSGTSGGSKACVIGQANMAASAAATAEGLERDARSRWLTPLPLHHINAQVIGLLAALHAGGAVALAPRLPPGRLWEAAARVGATGLSSVPAIVHDMLASGGSPPPTLTRVVCSSAALPPETRAAFDARFGVPLLPCYGLSEATGFVSLSKPAPASPRGSVGRPQGCEVRITGEGEIAVRGPGVFSGYDDAPEASAHALRDGWLHTGDAGRLDEAGFLYVDGRIKDLINRGGEKIPPDAVEAVLRTCPGVADVAVFAVPDVRLGEEVAAAVVAASGVQLDADALYDHCVDRLAEFETPRTWLFLDALPRGTTGKVLRRALQALHGELYGSEA